MADTTALLLAAGRGDRRALESFVSATQADVWRFCAHLVDVASADDLAQETYVRAMGSVARFRGESSGRTWLLAIARNTCADELRRRVRRRWREVRVEPATAESWPAPADPAAESLALDTTTAIANLDQDRREAFVLTQVLGLSYREAAQAADVPVGTIRSRVARARGDLVAHLGAGPADTPDRHAS